MLLRVKQASNPLFAFLLPADPLHPLYRWLVETRPQHMVVINAAPAAAAAGQGREEGQARGIAGAAAGPPRAPHPSEQWRVGPAEQPPPQPQEPPPWLRHREPPPPAAAAAPPAVEYGPALPPPGERCKWDRAAALAAE